MAVAVVPGSGDIVAAGDYAGTIEFGSGHLSSAGPSDGNIWLAAFTKHGDLKWVKSFGFTSSEHASDVAVDAAGNIYLTGTLQRADFGGGAIFSNGLGDFFVAKFDPNGKHIWSHGYGGTDQEAAYAFAVDGLGHVWVAGSFLGTTQLGGFTGIPSSGMADIFIARYGASDGLWQGNWIGTGADNGYGLCISSDASGNVYVAGVFGHRPHLRGQSHAGQLRPVGSVHSQDGEQWCSAVEPAPGRNHRRGRLPRHGGRIGERRDFGRFRGNHQPGRK
jgi:hypothetical protein